MKIAYERLDGGVSILHAPDDWDDATILSTIRKSEPTVVAFDRVDDTDLPEDRTFRNAWKKNGKKVDIDLEKAKTIAFAKGVDPAEISKAKNVDDLKKVMPK